ncbi:MAG: FGGY-family carbohydrate kinase [Synergistaceae bacterium]|jgi:xylulokinase|nr:FGGY-family carbohydrate kinase [Synergistaceae bacterium]
MGKYIIAHDLGTSGNKATLFTVEGEMKRSATFDYPVNYFHGNCAEQNPDDWWSAVCGATKSLLKEVDPADILAVSFSGQMMGCVCVDKRGTPLRPAIIWADMRSDAQEHALADKIDPKRFYGITGHKLSRSYSVEKLMWVRDNEPAIYEKTYKMLHAKEYIVCKMTGEFVTDYSDASGTNAFDINSMTWSDEIINAAGVEKRLFPDIKPSTFLAGGVSKTASAECGLSEGTKIILGGGDGSCASVGAGSIREGVTYNCLGSSSWISTVSREPFFDPEMRTVTWAHVIPGLLIPSGTMQTAGASYAWAKKLLFDDESAGENEYERINQAISESKAGSNALIFLPYLLGERCPRWNSNARASFVGLKMRHTAGDMMRSVMEGVAMNLDIILNILQRATVIDEMIVVGGLAQDSVQRQILADIYGMNVISLQYLEEATSIGAAVIAGVGIGVLEGFESAARFNKKLNHITPIKENVEQYRKLKPLFEKAYENQCEIFDSLAAI